MLESLKQEDLRSSHWKKLFRDAGASCSSLFSSELIRFASVFCVAWGHTFATVCVFFFSFFLFFFLSFAGVMETLDEATVQSWTLREMLQWLPKDQPSLVEVCRCVFSCKKGAAQDAEAHRWNQEKHMHTDGNRYALLVQC